MADYSNIRNKPIHRPEFYLAEGAIKVGGRHYAVFMPGGPSSANVTIYNVATTDATWTALATGLTNVIMWRLSERTGLDFRYAFVAAPTAYSTCFGSNGYVLTAISAIYIQRPAATNVNGQLEVWTA